MPAKGTAVYGRGLKNPAHKNHNQRKARPDANNERLHAGPHGE